MKYFRAIKPSGCLGIGDVIEIEEEFPIKKKQQISYAISTWIGDTKYHLHRLDADIKDEFEEMSEEEILIYRMSR
jgi:hypothetical protein